MEKVSHFRGLKLLLLGGHLCSSDMWVSIIGDHDHKCLHSPCGRGILHLSLNFANFREQIQTFWEVPTRTLHWNVFYNSKRNVCFSFCVNKKKWCNPSNVLSTMSNFCTVLLKFFIILDFHQVFNLELILVRPVYIISK